MAHTYGEVLQSSFPAIFACLPPQEGPRLFVDLGSGHGALCLAAVSCGFDRALGVEKYEDKFASSLQRLQASSPDHRSRVTFQKADLNGFDYAELGSGSSPCNGLLIFCNNVAMNAGTIQRCELQLSPQALWAEVASANQVVCPLCSQVRSAAERLSTSLPGQWGA